MATQKVLSNFIYIFIGLICFSTLFISCSYFVDAEILTKWYLLYIFTLTIYLIFSLRVKSIEIKIDILTFTLLLFIGYILSRNSLVLLHGMSTAFHMLAFLSLFLFFKLNNKLNIQVLGSIIVTACFFQAVWGLLEFIGILNNPTPFVIIGSFDNPAGFAASLSAGFAFCFTFFDKCKHLNFIILLVIAIIVLSIILSESRSGIIAVLLITILFFFHRFKFNLSKKRIRQILFISLFLLSTLFIFLYFSKKDSSNGRILIWKSIKEMIVQKPLLGYGGDTFRSQYMHYQADYFKNHPDSPYADLADNVVHPFNEYLLLTIEYGAVGTMLFLLLFFLICRNKEKRNYIFKLSVFSVLIFSFFSYPLRYPFVWFILAYSLAKIADNSAQLYVIKEIPINQFYKFIITCILVLSTCYIIKDIQFEYNWKKTAQSSLSGNTQTVLPEYENLYSHWNGNPLFLYNYGAELNYIKKHKQSISVLNECEKYLCDYDVCILQGNNYFKLKQWDVAEKYYHKASVMCPVRFIPLYYLHQIYDSTNLKIQAREIASEIVNKSIKIPSNNIFIIKQEMEKYIEISVQEKK